MGNMQFNRQTIINAIANKSIVWITGTDTSSLMNGTLGRVSIYSPKGTISRMYNCRLQWWGENDGTFTGTKEFIVDVQTQPGVGTGGVGMFKLAVAANNMLNYDQGAAVSPTTCNPSDTNAFQYQIANTEFDDGRAVQMVFNNAMNKPCTSKRNWDLFVEREVVSR